MKLVIEIPKGIYETMKNVKVMYAGDSLNKVFYGELHDAVLNGKVLPEGHGRLIDADELLKDDFKRVLGFREIDIKNAPTIIEADKGGDDYDY